MIYQRMSHTAPDWRTPPCLAYQFWLPLDGVTTAGLWRMDFIRIPWTCRNLIENLAAFADNSWELVGVTHGSFWILCFMGLRKKAFHQALFIVEFVDLNIDQLCPNVWTPDWTDDRIWIYNWPSNLSKSPPKCIELGLRLLSHRIVR